MKKIFFLTLLVLLSVPFLVKAKIGVGVGTGKIEIDQPMKAGLIYDLPDLVVLNTGDEASNYGVTIQHRENQPELIPEKSWFSFEPESFYLEPGKTKVVNIKLTLPIKGAKPGDYFVFLQAFPEKKEDVQGTSIGVAAASKLYFTVAPANIFVGMYYRVVSIFSMYSPWAYIVLGVLIASILVVTLRRFVSFNLGISVKKK